MNNMSYAWCKGGLHRVRYINKAQQCREFKIARDIKQMQIEIGSMSKGLCVDGAWRHSKGQPIGMSVFVTPWNSLAAATTRKIGPALAADCVVVFEPEKETGLTTRRSASLVVDGEVKRGDLDIRRRRRPRELNNDAEPGRRTATADCSTPGESELPASGDVDEAPAHRTGILHSAGHGRYFWRSRSISRRDQLDFNGAFGRACRCHVQRVNGMLIRQKFDM